MWAQPLVQGPFVMFIGPPGSGKTTQAQKAAKELRLPIISAEGMVHSNPAAFANTPGLSGMEPRSDPVMNRIFADTLASGNFTRGLIVDGYPSTKDHADYVRGLVLAGRLPNPVVIELDVPEEVVRQRLAKQAGPSLEQRIKDYQREMGMVQVYFPSANIHKVDANRKPEKVAEDVNRILLPLLQTKP
jgi:adenylate kinase